MAEKTQDATVQERSEKTAKKPAERTQAAMLAGKRALLVAQKKLAAKRKTGVTEDVKLLTLEDAAMTADDPGLKDAMLFSRRLETGESRVLSKAESAASRETARKEMAEIQKQLNQLLRKPNP